MCRSRLLVVVATQLQVIAEHYLRVCPLGPSGVPSTLGPSMCERGGCRLARTAAITSLACNPTSEPAATALQQKKFIFATLSALEP